MLASDPCSAPWDAFGVEVVGSDLRSLFALLEVVHSVISVDTGPAHAAAALGAPLIVLFGNAPQSVWLPRGGSGMPIFGIGGPPERHHTASISVREAVEAWNSLLFQRESVVRSSVTPRTSAEADADDGVRYRKLALTL